jgi:hypothetical protein
MKCLLSALAVTALAVPAASVASQVDPGFSQVPVTINRAGATSIRACTEEFGGAYTAVCYNQVTGLQVGPLDFSKENVVRVVCDRRFPRTDKTTRGQVASEFCPQVDAGVLAPAPFLL